jgi:hypothetical protein
MDCNRTARSACGVGGIFSEYGSPPDHAPGWIVSTRLTFFQKRLVGQRLQWHVDLLRLEPGQRRQPGQLDQVDRLGDQRDECSSAQERKSGFCAGLFGRDAGSTYRSAPPG